MNGFAVHVSMATNFVACAGVAQLAEQLPCKQQVVGSSPTASYEFLL
jgi:hypothetical protein